MRIASLSLLGMLAATACAHQSQGAEPAPAGPAVPRSDIGVGTLEVAEVPTDVRGPEPLDRAPTQATLPAPIASPGAPSALRAGAAPASTSAAGTAASAAAAPTKAESDLRARIQRALLRERGLSYTAKRVRIEVERHDVTLLGEVRTAHEKGEVEAVIQQVTGVQRVKNQLAVIDQAVTAETPHQAPTAAQSAR